MKNCLMIDDALIRCHTRLLVRRVFGFTMSYCELVILKLQKQISDFLADFTYVMSILNLTEIFKI